MMDTIVTQQAEEPNDIGRNFLLGNRKKIAKFLMRTFTCRSTFLYALASLPGKKKQEVAHRYPDFAYNDKISEH